MVMSRGWRQVAAGLLIGLTAAFGVTGGLRALLVGVSATDPATFVAIALFQTAVAALACWIPARRAAGLDPVEALRQQ
jgi:ABC-type lipoprotein release transport system permease subunit